MSLYNTSNITINNLYDVASYLNTIEPALIGVIVGGIFVLLFVGLSSKYDYFSSLAVAGFISGLFALMMFATGISSSLYYTLPLVFGILIFGFIAVRSFLDK